jgi:hypothetical protein
MGKMPTHIRGFIQDMKPLYYVAKMLGLAPFTLKIDGATNEEIIDVKFSSNICGFAASAIVVIVLLTGFVFETFLPEFSFRRDPHQVVTYVVSVPLNFVGSLVLVIMNSTVNRYKIEKMVKILSSVDERLILLRSGHFGQRGRKKVQVFMPVLLLAFLLLFCDVCLAVEKLDPVFCIIERSCQMITLVAIMQYCKMALMIRGRLTAMHEILSITFCKRLSHTSCDLVGSAAFSVTSKVSSQTCKTLHTSRINVGGDLEEFNGIETKLNMAPFIEVELLLKHRRIYYHLYECVKIINFMYGLPILIHIFRTGTGLISSMYNVGPLFNGHPDVGYILTYIIWTTVLLCPIISLTVICDMTASKSKDIGHKLQALLLTDNVSIELEKQLKLFCQQLSNDKIAFTAAGLFDVNLSFLCTLVTSITTYTLVIIQFKLH